MKSVLGVLLIASVALCTPAEDKAARDKRQLVLLVPSVSHVVPVVPLGRRPRQACGIPAIRCEGYGCESKAVGGIPALQNEYPWVVQILSNGQSICGGSVIGESYILTSASCLEPSPNSKINPNSVAALKVVLGDHKRNSFDDGIPIERNVSIAYLHANYKAPGPRDTPVYDIAVLKMGAPVPFSGRVQPICLDDGTFRLDTGMYEGIVAGWGKTSYNTLPQDPVMHKSNVNVLSQQECRTVMSSYNNNPIRDEEICAGVPVKDSCVNDLGGPLFYRTASNVFIQSGIASWGVSCNGPPGVFTRVSTFRSWIDAVITKDHVRSTYDELNTIYYV